jgi:hypothetical protein
MAIDLQEFAVRGDREGRYGKGGNDIWMYWRIPERTDAQGNVQHARIVGKPAWPVEFMRQVRKGMQPLPEYGEFFPEAVKYKGQAWQYQSNPYRLLLLKGGAKEFSVGQLVELGWHRKPPIKGIEFPQLAGLTFEDHVCATCRKVYKSVEDLQAHESIAHATLSSHKALGRQLAEATQGVVAGSNESMARALEMLAGAIGALGTRLDDIDKRLPPAESAQPKPAPRSPRP